MGKLKIHYQTAFAPFRRCVLLLLCGLSSGLLCADNVTEAEAMKRAVGFFNASALTRTSSANLRMVWNGQNGATRSNQAPAFYVFNRTDGAGFVIVAGDDRVAPILGYSHSNSFKVEGMPNNLKEWMRSYSEQVECIRSYRPNTPKVAQTQAYAMDRNVELLYETAEWSQDAPYNNKCPNGAVTGCVATAVSIIMRYHQWPDRGVGTLPDYEYTVEGVGKKQQAGHKLGYSYLWDKMPLKKPDTKEAEEAVSTLIYDCAIMSKSIFGEKETGASTNVAVISAADYMKYNKGMRIITREWNDPNIWLNMLKQELRTNGPIFYSGVGSGSAHQFVIDGYNSSNEFHVNWGWSGNANGYYLITALTPPTVGMGGAVLPGGYNMTQSAVFGFSKAKVDDTDKNFLMLCMDEEGKDGYFYGFKSPYNTGDYNQSTPFRIQVAFRNRGIKSLSGQIVLSLVDGEGVVRSDICDPVVLTDVPILSGQYQDFPTCKIPVKLQPGDRIWLRYKGNGKNDEWVHVLGEPRIPSELLVADAYPESISDKSSFTYNRRTKVITIKTMPGANYYVFLPDGTISQEFQGEVSASGEFALDTSTWKSGKYKIALYPVGLIATKTFSVVIGGKK